MSSPADYTPQKCECCDNTSDDLFICEGCDGCQECCNCTETDCDCESCEDRRAER